MPFASLNSAGSLEAKPYTRMLHSYIIPLTSLKDADVRYST